MGRNSIIFNCLSVLFLVVTLNISVVALFLLGIYVFVRWRLMKPKGWREVKRLLGPKTYGSLSLALALNDLDYLFWARIETNMVLLLAIISAMVVFAIQGVVRRKDIRLRL